METTTGSPCPSCETFPDGGPFELPMVGVWTVAGGRITRLEIFETEDVDAALARFEELRPDPLRIPPNAATRASDRHQRATQTRDWAALDALCAPTLEFDDRRRAALTTGGRDMFIASSRLSGGAGTRTERTVLATAGDRLALEHVRWIGADDAVPFEAESLSLTEVDADGRIVAVIGFDPDDRRAASLELVERWIRGEGRWASGVLEFRRALITRDLERCRAALPDDFVFHDHRRIGAGRLETADAYVAWVGALFAESPDAIFEPIYDLARAEHGILSVGHVFGTLAEGGPFEAVSVQILHLDCGRPVAAEVFELEDLDAAQTRFEELRADRPPSAG